MPYNRAEAEAGERQLAESKAQLYKFAAAVVWGGELVAEEDKLLENDNGTKVVLLGVSGVVSPGASAAVIRALMVGRHTAPSVPLPDLNGQRFPLCSPSKQRTKLVSKLHSFPAFRFLKPLLYDARQCVSLPPDLPGLPEVGEMSVGLVEAEREKGNTMKRGDKAIVPNSFGKWQSSSPRSRTMEKLDEPSEAAEEESLSNCTCPRKARSDRRCPPFPAFPLRP
ncbi:unnamed protein product [Leuciscus chuanchicus]